MGCRAAHLHHSTLHVTWAPPKLNRHSRSTSPCVSYTGVALCAAKPTRRFRFGRARLAPPYAAVVVSLRPCSSGTSVCCGCTSGGPTLVSVASSMHLLRLALPYFWLHLGGLALVSAASVNASSSAGTSVCFGCTSEDRSWFRSHQSMHIPMLRWHLGGPALVSVASVKNPTRRYASVAPRRAGFGFGHISQCTSICFGGTSADRPWFRSPHLTRRRNCAPSTLPVAFSQGALQPWSSCTSPVQGRLRLGNAR
jgi:hypothetical protein